MSVFCILLITMSNTLSNRQVYDTVMTDNLNYTKLTVKKSNSTTSVIGNLKDNIILLCDYY